MVRIFQFLLRQQGIRNVITAGQGEQIMVSGRTPQARAHSSGSHAPRQRWPQRAPRSQRPGVHANHSCDCGVWKESQEQVQQAMMAGAIDYVIKPFEPMELGVRIKSFLDTLNESSQTNLGGLR